MTTNWDRLSNVLGSGELAGRYVKADPPPRYRVDKVGDLWVVVRDDGLCVEWCEYKSAAQYWCKLIAAASLPPHLRDRAEGDKAKMDSTIGWTGWQCPYPRR